MHGGMDAFCGNMHVRRLLAQQLAGAITSRLPREQTLAVPRAGRRSPQPGPERPPDGVAMPCGPDGVPRGAGTVAGVGGVRDTVPGDLVPGGVLRAAINLGNPVLAQGPAAAPAGVTVDIARELGTRLRVEVNLACFTAARESLAAIARGDADICFLAIEPALAAEVAFITPYVVIEGVFVVPVESAITTVADADRVGVRIGVNEGSAYDLLLSWTLRQASVVRGRDGVKLFREQGLGAGAGISQVVSGFVAGNPGVCRSGRPWGPAGPATPAPSGS
jgi:polar amino acid transport system substrate-binding protein